MFSNNSFSVSFWTKYLSDLSIGNNFCYADELILKLELNCSKEFALLANSRTEAINFSIVATCSYVADEASSGPEAVLSATNATHSIEFVMLLIDPAKVVLNPLILL